MWDGNCPSSSPQHGWVPRRWAGSIEANPRLWKWPKNTHPARQRSQGSYTEQTRAVFWLQNAQEMPKLRSSSLPVAKHMAVNLNSDSGLTRPSVFHISLWCSLVTLDTQQLPDGQSFPLAVAQPLVRSTGAAGCADHQLLLHQKPPPHPHCHGESVPALASSHASSGYKACIKRCKERDNINILNITLFLVWLIKSIPSLPKCIHFFTCWYPFSLQVLCVYIDTYIHAFTTLASRQPTACYLWYIL